MRMLFLDVCRVSESPATSPAAAFSVEPERLEKNTNGWTCSIGMSLGFCEIVRLPTTRLGAGRAFCLGRFVAAANDCSGDGCNLIGDDNIALAPAAAGA